ncbi:phosphoesteras-like protein [Clohesyomyces aquaticus]|uniref:Phosphoesteras-like protein n=1 Tax=Clohesyomyces aquaticus TaxID=1231657 RepID=A0A1Y1ZEJ7_9PLEO|nr:phosphoesteras-like protein [Clohesyomyces aquaticus]
MQVRTGIQLGVLTFIVFLLVFFLDNRYRVLPQSVHNRLPLHHEGLVITDITVNTCSSLNPLSSCKLDQDKWHRVEKNLYLKSGYFSKAYVHIKRKREEELTDDDKVILDVKIGKLDPAIGEKSQAAEKWESRPSGIWLKRSAKRHASDSKRVITAVDVLFGTDAVEPRAGWELVKPGALLLDTGSHAREARLSIRRGPPHKLEKPVPRIRKDGKFKIVQVSDLHLSTGEGVCRDPEPKNHNGGHCEADPRTLEFVERVLDEEKPDMVVLSGDQVNGETAPDAQSAMFKIIQVLAERHIPWAAIFGNHDDEGSLSRLNQMSLYESLPFSLSEAGANTIDGVGNYYVEVLAHSGKHSALTLYLLDTHGYSPDEAHFKGYDWLKPNQINWFKAAAQGLKESQSHQHYTHIHLDMAFIHIPLPEYALDLPIVGNRLEGVTAPGFNSHFKDALVEEGVKVVSCGHDHANDYCAFSKDVKTGEGELWMCYAGGSGFGGYGGYGGYHRRLRVFEIDSNQGRISTWKRLEYGDVAKRLDEQVIVDSGKVVSPQSA